MGDIEGLGLGLLDTRVSVGSWWSRDSVENAGAPAASCKVSGSDENTGAPIEPQGLGEIKGVSGDCTTSRGSSDMEANTVVSAAAGASVGSKGLGGIGNGFGFDVSTDFFLFTS